MLTKRGEFSDSPLFLQAGSAGKPFTGHAGDLDEDGDVDRTDLAIFMPAWLTEAGDAQWNPDCDIGVPADNRIDVLDFVVLAGNWVVGIQD